MKTERTDAQVLMTVSRLQEFYSSGLLYGFFKRCEEHGVDVVEAFVALDALVIGYVHECGEPPDLEMASGCLLVLCRKVQENAGHTSSAQG